MNVETKLKRAQEESAQFGQYAEYMLSEFPEMNLPTLRDCYKHNASATEYRLHSDRIAGRQQCLVISTQAHASPQPEQGLVKRHEPQS